jgi:hypothetical protein
VQQCCGAALVHGLFRLPIGAPLVGSAQPAATVVAGVRPGLALGHLWGVERLGAVGDTAARCIG